MELQRISMKKKEETKRRKYEDEEKKVKRVPGVIRVRKKVLKRKAVARSKNASSDSCGSSSRQLLRARRMNFEAAFRKWVPQRPAQRVVLQGSSAKPDVQTSVASAASSAQKVHNTFKGSAIYQRYRQLGLV